MVSAVGQPQQAEPKAAVAPVVADGGAGSELAAVPGAADSIPGTGVSLPQEPLGQVAVIAAVSEVGTDVDNNSAVSAEQPQLIPVAASPNAEVIAAVAALPMHTEPAPIAPQPSPIEISSQLPATAIEPESAVPLQASSPVSLQPIASPVSLPPSHTPVHVDSIAIVANSVSAPPQ